VYTYLLNTHTANVVLVDLCELPAQRIYRLSKTGEGDGKVTATRNVGEI